MSESTMPKRRFWQIHLSTAVILMFAAGGLVGGGIYTFNKYSAIVRVNSPLEQICISSKDDGTALAEAVRLSYLRRDLIAVASPVSNTIVNTWGTLSVQTRGVFLKILYDGSENQDMYHETVLVPTMNLEMNYSKEEESNGPFSLAIDSSFGAVKPLPLGRIIYIQHAEGNWIEFSENRLDIIKRKLSNLKNAEIDLASGSFDSWLFRHPTMSIFIALGILIVIYFMLEFRSYSGREGRKP